MDYNGLNAKISAMRGSLLKRSDYENLATAVSVDDAGKKIFELQGYSGKLNGEPGELRRAKLEHLLTMPLFEDFRKIRNFISDYAIKRLIETFFKKYEANIVKNLLAHAQGGHSAVFSPAELNVFFGNNLPFDAEKLISSKNAAEFTENLKDTFFYTPVSRALAASGEEKTVLFEMFMSLDLHYYKNLYKSLKTADAKNGSVLKRLYGVEIDAANIVRIYRLKKYYKMSSQELYSYLIPVHFKLPQESLERMAEARTDEETEAEIKASFYGSAFSFEKSEGLGLYPAEIFFRNTVSRAYSSLKKENGTIVPALDYLFRRDTEIKNLMSLLEGVRYGLEAADIMKFIAI